MQEYKASILKQKEKYMEAHKAKLTALTQELEALQLELQSLGPQKLRGSTASLTASSMAEDKVEDISESSEAEKEPSQHEEEANDVKDDSPCEETNETKDESTAKAENETNDENEMKAESNAKDDDNEAEDTIEPIVTDELTTQVTQFAYTTKHFCTELNANKYINKYNKYTFIQKYNQIFTNTKSGEYK